LYYDANGKWGQAFLVRAHMLIARLINIFMVIPAREIVNAVGERSENTPRTTGKTDLINEIHSLVKKKICPNKSSGANFWARRVVGVARGKSPRR
jgi:hypothetical protein